MTSDLPRPPTVWIIQEAWGDRPMDLSSLHRYGALRYMFDQRDLPSLTPGPALAKLQRIFAREFNEDTDYLCSLPTGDPLALVLVGIVLEQRRMIEPNKGIQWLRWERERITGENGVVRSGAGFYVPTIVKGT